MSRSHGCERETFYADTSKTRRKHIHVGSTKTNNIHVKRPVRHPCLSLRVFHTVKLRLVFEGLERIYTGIVVSSI